MSVEKKLKASFSFNTILLFIYLFIYFLSNEKKKQTEVKHYGGESL